MIPKNIGKTAALTAAAALMLSLTGCFNVSVNVLPFENGGSSAVPELSPADEAPASQAEVYDIPSEAPVSEIAAEISATEAPVTAAPATEAPATVAPAAETTTAKPENKTPDSMNAEELVSFFNASLNAVKRDKVGFKKSKLTSILDLQLSNSVANSLVSLVKSVLLSDTADETAVNRGESSDGVMSPSGKSFVSELSASDCSSVKCTADGDKYIITVSVADATNPDENSVYAKIFDFITVDDVVNIYAPKVGATVARENIEVTFSGCWAKLTTDASGRVYAYETYVKGCMNMKDASVKKGVTIKTDVAVTLGSTTDYSDFSY